MGKNIYFDGNNLLRKVVFQMTIIFLNGNNINNRKNINDRNAILDGNNILRKVLFKDESNISRQK